MLNGLDLFTGIGGLTIALSDWVRPIAYCENNRYCQGVLLSRMVDRGLPKAPIAEDIGSLTPSDFAGRVDIVYGGFPCQGISVAGVGAGLEDERTGLFYELARLCDGIKPRFIFLENVPAICSRGGAEVVRKITSMGYDSRWCVISAASVGAIHKRDRWFLLAYNCSQRTQGESERSFQRQFKLSGSEDVGRFEAFTQRSNLHTPKLCGGGDGIPFKMDRTHALGNSVVPEQARQAFKVLMGIK